jgi:hypothetical protein
MLDTCEQCGKPVPVPCTAFCSDVCCQSWQEEAIALARQYDEAFLAEPAPAIPVLNAEDVLTTNDPDYVLMARAGFDALRCGMWN